MSTGSSLPPDERFAEWVDGCMSPRDRERFEAELRVNAALRAELAAYERTVAVVREALQAEVVPTALADRVLAAVQAAPGPKEPRLRRSFAAYVYGGLAAAALMVAAVWFDAWVAPARDVDKGARLDAAVERVPPDAGPAVELTAETLPEGALPEGFGGSAPNQPPSESSDRVQAPAAEQAPGAVLRFENDDEAPESAAKKAKAQGEQATGAGVEEGERKALRDSPGRVGGTKDSASDDRAPRPGARQPDTSGAAEAPLVGGLQPGGEAAEPTAPNPAPAAPVVPTDPVAVDGVRQPAPGAAKPRADQTVPPAAEPKQTGPTGGAGPGAAPPFVGGAAPRSRGASSKGPAGAFAGPIPVLTIDRRAGPGIAPPAARSGPPTGEAAKERSKAPPADRVLELPQAVDHFLATAGAGAGDEVVWRTERGSLVLRAVDPGMLRDVAPSEPRRSAPQAIGGGGGGPVVVPAPRAWLIVGAPADIEVLLARLGLKVRTEGWQLQTGEFETPRASPPAGTGGTLGFLGDSPAPEQRSVLLHFRFGP